MRVSFLLSCLQPIICSAALSSHILANDFSVPGLLRFEPIRSAEIICFLTLVTERERNRAKLEHRPNPPHHFTCIAQPATYHTVKRVSLNNPNHLKTAVEELITNAKADQSKAGKKQEKEKEDSDPASEEIKAKRIKANEEKLKNATKITAKELGLLRPSFSVVLVLTLSFACVVYVLLNNSGRRLSYQPKPSRRLRTKPDAASTSRRHQNRDAGPRTAFQGSDDPPAQRCEPLQH